jgi:NADH-quinone oxidoreductase subunit F
VAGSLARFFERESCGQCPPCSLGTATLSRIAAGLETTRARARDLEDAADVAGFMAGHGYCAHSRTAAHAITGLFRRFPDHVAAHVAGACPGGGTADPFAEGSPERAGIEAALEPAVLAALESGSRP